MAAAPLPPDEPARLAALLRLGVLDSPPEPQFEALVTAAALVCEAPIALISLVDAERQWFLANVGLPGTTQTPREHAFCAHTILGDDLLEIPDATRDGRFDSNPLVVGRPDIRFYAGAPICVSAGKKIGTLCVIDRQPRQLTPQQRQVLEQLAVAVAHAIESRLAERSLAEAEAALREKRARLAAILEGTGAGTWEWNVQTGETRFNERWAAIVGTTLAELGPTTIETWAELVPPEDLAVSSELLERHFDGQTPSYECEARMRHRDGHLVWVSDRGRVLTRTPDGRPEWMFGTHLDITHRKEQEQALVKSEELSARTGELAQVGGWEFDLVHGHATWSAQTCRIHGVPTDCRPTLEEAVAFYAPEARPVIERAIRQAIAEGGGWDLELPLEPRGGDRIWVRTVGSAEVSGGRPVRLVGAIQDITARVEQRLALERLSAELSEQHSLLWVTLQSIGDAVITTDPHGDVSWLNPVAERLTGFTSDEAQGRPLSLVLPLRKDGGGVLVDRDGADHAVEVSTSPIRSDQGEALGAVVVFRDVTDQRRLNTEMQHRATHDPLTGIVNRAEFETRLRRTLERAQAEGSEHSLLYIDLDQFKLVNDSAGHFVGDRLLIAVSRLLGECVRASDTLARLGGDEFGVILEQCRADQAAVVAQKVCDRMNDFRFAHEERRFRIGASIGLVPIDRRWSTAADVLQAADAACYAAKEAGRNRVYAWFDTDSAVRERKGEMEWATRLEQALDDDRFVLFAQRIEALRDAVPRVHAEVLLRMVDVDGSLKAPGAFLPAAERFHLSSRIDRWVLRHAIAELSALVDLTRVDTLCVNLSGQSVGDRAFHQHAIELLARSGPELCRRLCIEITETAAVTNMVDAARFIREVRLLGVRVALDDFGAGASSFGYLKTLTVDVLKIDGQFIRGLVTDPLDDATVRCFVDVARVLGLRTVAEFVDHPDVLRRLGEVGVDYAQGYLLHRPEPIALVLASASLQERRNAG